MKHVILLTLLLAGVASPLSVTAAQSVTITVFTTHDDFIRLSPAYGLSWRILQRAAEHSDIVLDKRKVVWQGAKRQLKAHKADLTFGALYSKQRKQWAHFSLPLASATSALYVTSSSEQGPIDKENGIVGVSKNTIQHHYAKKLGFKKIYTTRSVLDLFGALNGGRMDYALMSDGFVRFYCDGHVVSQCPVRLSGTLITSTIRFITAKDNSAMIDVVDRLNRAILAIAVTDDIRDLFTHFGYSKQDYQQWLTLVQSRPQLNQP